VQIKRLRFQIKQTLNSQKDHFHLLKKLPKIRSRPSGWKASYHLIPVDVKIDSKLLTDEQNRSHYILTNYAIISVPKIKFAQLVQLPSRVLKCIDPKTDYLMKRNIQYRISCILTGSCLFLSASDSRLF